LFSSSTDKAVVGPAVKAAVESPAMLTSDTSNTSDAELVAHACSTLGTEPYVKNEDMELPSHWRDPDKCDKTVGHQEGGRTLCLHSFVVDPKLHRSGVGKLAMRLYLEKAKAMDVDRVALICQKVRAVTVCCSAPRSSTARSTTGLTRELKKPLVEYYQQFGFKHHDMRRATFGGSHWDQMVCT
jgi:GNAT superfamily N-acetyltransferase